MLLPPALSLTGLKQIPAERASLQNMVLALLDSDGFGANETMAAHVVPPAAQGDSAQGDSGQGDSGQGDSGQSNSGHWLSVGHGLYIHFVRIAGKAALFHAERLQDIVATIDAAEPLLLAIEARLGIAIEPDSVVTSLPSNALIIAVASNETQHLIHMAFGPAFDPPATLKAAFASLDADWARTPVAYELQLCGPVLPIEVAADLGVGDMLLIGNGAVAARIIWPLAGVAQGCAAPSEINRSVSILGRYDINNGNFITTGTPAVEQESIMMTMSDASERQTTAPTPGFAVPLSIRLPVRMASVADLSTMRVGTTFAIGPVAQGLPVSLMVADREIAFGELVQVGDQFAVLIDHKPDLIMAQPAPLAEEGAP